ncbi:MAG TPA: indole-3-glycerol phosphate synthase TrpC [Vicinamibacterales bacterium]|nr:indole-3-glycerol phosphate synthase TrpC [Vicinamibacterales bacterium]
MTASLLETVVAGARRSAEMRERAVARPAFEEAWAGKRPRGDLFEVSLRQPGTRIIAECKRRSPARGVLRVNYDPAAIARSYETAGAAAISVLTEPTFFDGSLAHLSAVRSAVELPLLCKDFLTSEFQLLEARAAGADAVLLIVAALDQQALARLIAHARALGLAALVEVHDRDELGRALDAGASIVGVNCRSLRTLEVSTAVFDELAASLPGNVVAVAESGLKSGADVGRLRAARYDAFLIGERFMVAADPGAALAGLLAGAGSDV